MNASAPRVAPDTAYPASYYAASAHAAPERPTLEDTIAPDVCIIGAGYSGLSAGIDLAGKGYKVVILEAAKVGWGASGRNGGQIVNGLNAGLDRIEARYGRGTADFVGTMLQEGGRLIRERIKRFGIDCDLKEGNVFAAFTARQMRDLEAKKALWARHGMDDHEMLDRAGIRAHVATEAYVGGMIDHSGGHMHPLNLALGEAAAFESLGGTVHEASAVTRIDDIAGAPVVHTAGGEVRPKVLILAGNAYLGRVVPALENRVMPFSTQIIATEPLGERGAGLLPSDMCRRGRALDTRLLPAVGGRATAVRRRHGLRRHRSRRHQGQDPAQPREDLPAAQGRAGRLRLVRQLRAVVQPRAADGPAGTPTYYACGYSGHGVVGSHLFGRIVASAVAAIPAVSTSSRTVPWLPFPGGRRFRVPYSMVGSWWYGLRDRLGV
jgi:gamma-glutamylputrescine oxidase